MGEGFEGEPAGATVGPFGIRAGTTHHGRSLALAEGVAVADELEGGFFGVAVAEEPGEVSHGLP